ncbi:GNAT family N-acetyltransferase [Longispora sp. NPDC051575]|uniref:GNAT family N-acetyltransferase n=1 Tax=Longispora sp. NPDC051575 TaxID=3154943 RepID=UPI00342181FF
MEILALDPHHPSAGTWYAAMYAGCAAGRTAPPVIGELSLLTGLRTNSTNPNSDRRAWGAWEGGRCLGTLLLALSRQDNTHLAGVDVNVPPEHRGRGVGAALFERGLAEARLAGRTVVGNEVNVTGELADSPGGRFALARGFVSQHTEQRLLLDLPLADADLAAREREGAERSAGYRALSWTGVVPAARVDDLVRLHNQMQRDVPSGDLDREPVAYDAERLTAGQTRSLAQGYGMVTTMVLDPAGAPAAYTMMYVAADGGSAFQDDTFVLTAHRGHRLGTLAKAANLRLLAEHFPATGYVHTWTAQVNDAMRSINERFGFRPVETMHAVELRL